MTFVKVLAMLLSMQAILVAQYRDPTLRKGSTPANVGPQEPKVGVRRAGRSRYSSRGIPSANTNASRELQKVESKGTNALHATSAGSSSKELEKVENERIRSSHITSSQSSKNRSRTAVSASPGNSHPEARNERNKPIKFSYHPSNASNKQATLPVDKTTGRSNSPH